LKNNLRKNNVHRKNKSTKVSKNLTTDVTTDCLSVHYNYFGLSK